MIWKVVLTEFYLTIRQKKRLNNFYLLLIFPSEIFANFSNYAQIIISKTFLKIKNNYNFKVISCFFVI